MPFVLISCSGDSSKKKAKPLDTANILRETQPHKKSAKKTAFHPGQAVYNEYCLACHQSDGSGIAGMYPPLSQNQYILNKDKLIDVVLNGMSGKIEVNGDIYNNFMVPHSHLSDEELANVISYVRSNFGNDLEPVTKEEIAAFRKNEE